MLKVTRLKVTCTAVVSIASLVAACSGTSSKENGTGGSPGSGPVEGEIPGGGGGGGSSGSSGAGGTAVSGTGGSGTGGSGFGGSAGAGGGAGSSGSGAGGSGAAGGSAGAGGSGAVGGSSGTGGAPPVLPGTLTAGAWDDNQNFERFLGYRAELHAPSSAGFLGLTVDEHQASYEASFGWLVPHQQLDIALVFDTTGSMGDEIEYLKTELIAISGTIAELHPNAAQRWSLILYRDLGDEYLVRWFGFRDGAQEVQQRLALQSAGGGGDFPEAPEAAFAQLNQLYWRGGAGVARLAFWFADAPHHSENAPALTTALRRTRELGVHVYPIASSGVDELTELSMRSAAQITGGRYLFLTDDSGAGGAHKEPAIPCYFVTKLDDAIVRMVDIEMSGVYREPSPEHILRTGGDPQNGACALSGSGAVAY